MHEEWCAPLEFWKFITKRRLMYRHSLLLLALTGCISIGCSAQNDRSSIIGTWNVSDYNADAPELSPILIQSTKVLMMSGTYTFNEDGSFVETIDSEPERSHGKWKLKGSNELVMTYDNEASDLIHIIEGLDKSMMKWFDDMGEIGSATVHLTRAE